jgi:hypothetical protein
MIKNSVGVWAFGPAVTRFVPPADNYDAEGAKRRKESREARASRGEA